MVYKIFYTGQKIKMSQVQILVESVTFSSFSLTSGEWTQELLREHETWTVNVVVVHLKSIQIPQQQKNALTKLCL